jgi:hypothetical protein
MPTVEINTARPNAQRHLEVALSLAQGIKTNAAPPPVPVVLPIKPAKRVEFTADWLDTPADHCSPLDDY